MYSTLLMLESANIIFNFHGDTAAVLKKLITSYSHTVYASYLFSVI